MAPLRGSKILITGPTGQVARPLTLRLAQDNDVWGIARFKDAAVAAELEAAGVTCRSHNLATDDFDSLPDDFDYVLNLAVVKSGNWERDLAANAESVGRLRHHCGRALACLQ